MKYKTLLLFFLIFCTINIFSHETINKDDLIKKVNLFRLELEQYENPTIIMDKISNYESNLLASNDYKNSSNEIQLVLENILFLEKLKNQVKLAEKDKEKLNQLKDETSLQIQKTLKEITSLENSSKTPSKWLLVNYGDLISFSLQFATLSQAIKNGLEVKNYYIQALDLDSNMSFALLNLGMWYYYVPSVAGGDKKLTIKYIQKAVNDATNQSEQYFSLILYSQILFENKEFDEAKIQLEKAKELCPKSFNIKFMEKLNNLGISWIEYSANPKKFDKKLNLNSTFVN